MQYLQFNFTNLLLDNQNQLIAQLNTIGFDGFEEEENLLKAFVPTEKFNQQLFAQLVDDKNIDYEKITIEEQNWNAKWEADFEPIEVLHPIKNEKFVYLRTNFHKPNIAFEHDIIITPKMSFGTGHHPTTYLMSAHMGEIDFKNKAVIDFGTGTGVLAILAEKLGAESVLGIDYDHWSIENALENAHENKCLRTTFLKADTIPAEFKADIILANINLNIITQHIEAIKLAALPNAQLLFSGIMEHDEEDLKNVLQNASFKLVETYTRENWRAVLATIK